MREILTVFKFTFHDALRKKAFIISTVIILSLILIGTIVASVVMNISDSSNNKDSVSETETANITERSMTCYIINGEYIPGLTDALNTSVTNVNFIEGNSVDAEIYATNIENDSKVSTLTISADDASLVPTLSYTASSGMFDTQLPYEQINSVVKNIYVTTVMSSAGITPEMTELALSDIPYSVSQLGGLDISGYIIGILLTMLIFMSVYYYGYGVAMSVAAEKTSRVMETLIMSAKPSHILIGKCLAMGVVGFLQLTAILIVSAACYTFAFAPKIEAMGIDISISSFGISSMLLVIVYFILGYTLFAMMNSVCGASISRTEDLNSALMPTMLISLVSFYAGYMGIFMSGDTFRKVVSLIPFTAPFIMPFRLLNDTVPAYEIILSILLMIILIIFVTMVSIRLYTASVLYYGQKLKIKDMFKLKN